MVLWVRGQDAGLTSRLLVPVQAARQVRVGRRWPPEWECGWVLQRERGRRRAEQGGLVRAGLGPGGAGVLRVFLRHGVPPVGMAVGVVEGGAFTGVLSRV
ncbi:hypothetical protein DEGR_39260 (plasmid) [Deinococcus grandis]|nr:hypothetical protein DEGR_39260 [Deinococcus grandis]